MALIPEFFLDCVVAVGQRGRNSAVNWGASGFLYGHFQRALDDGQKQYAIYLVTNRHVFEDVEEAVLRFNPEGAARAREFGIHLRDKGHNQWLAHADPDIDAAVLPIGAQKLVDQQMSFSFFRSDQHVADRATVTAGGIVEGDGVYILGFPLGLVGNERSYVIVRQGCIARIRDWLGGNAKDFLVDATIFPGNSGGPVVYQPTMVAIQGTTPFKSSILLGLVKAYLSYRDVAISAQTGRERIVFEENSGLAAVVPIDFIQEVVAEHSATMEPQEPIEQREMSPSEGEPLADAGRADPKAANSA